MRYHHGRMQPRLVVVAGLVWLGPQRLLVQRRPPHASHGAGCLELPGGKVEPGEAPTAALVRELREELGVTAEVGRIWEVLFHPYPAFDLVMLVYRCRLPLGEVPTCREVADLTWRPPDRLGDLDVLPADAPLCARLAVEGPPPWQP